MNIEKIDARTYAGLFVFTLLVHGLWHAGAGLPVFADNDGFVRALRVEALWRGGGWFDTSFPRANAPLGAAFHWTRPLDVVISLLALPMVPVLGVKPAIFWGGAISGPVLHAATVVAFAWAALPLAGRTAATLAGIAATVQYGLISYGALARGDHHIFYAFFAALGSGFAIRALDRNRAGHGYAFLAGVAAAGGVWIGIEGFVVALLALAAFGLAWLKGDDPPDSPKARRFAAGFAAGLAGALALESGPSFFVVVYDRISIVHVTLGALLALFFLAVRLRAPQSPLTRAGAALAGAAVAAGVWVLLFPKALLGPLADVDPAYARLLAENLGELESGATFERFPATLGATVLALPWLVWRLWREKSGRWLWAWAYVAICVAVFGALTANWVRWMIYAGLFPCLVLGDMIARATERLSTQKIHPALREAGSAAVVAFFLLGPPVSAYVSAIAVAPPAKSGERERAQACAGGGLASALNRPPWSERPRTILMGMNYVGEILYRTPHRTVGMAYHRTEGAVRDTLAAFSATDDAVVREILTRRDIELIAICPGFPNEGLSPRSREEGGFYARLIAEPPAWVRKIELPAEASAFRLFEVLPEGRGR